MIDAKTFFSAIRGPLFDGALSQRQVNGLDALLKAWADGYADDDDRWLAYCLATAYHETGRAMWPVPEGGKGKGHPYGVADATGQIPYGRGFVQLTWTENYAKADAELHLNGALVKNYDLALTPDVAADILFRGMVEGWFTKFKLADYLNATKADYLNARRIVNGTDKAADIAGYAEHFASAITAAKRIGSDTTPKVDPGASPASTLAVPAPASLPAPPPLPELPDLGSLLGGLLNPIAPASSAPSSASASDPKPTTASQDSISMNPIATIIGLIQTAQAAASVVSQYGTVMPTIVKDVEDVVPAAEKMFTDLGGIVSDLKAGKYSDATGADLQKVIADVEDVVSKASITFGAIAGAVNKTPSLPSVVGLKTAAAA